ncbi:MAG: DUF4491 family protein [Chloroflexi bacterium]|nr:MAG: DUF4491 family protein [Chloroflexota bacterium]MCE7858369.1 DUF4491 family protein [Chloroflexi bacterium CFX2]
MNIAINSLGLVAAVTAFLTIWIGHVAVRKIEAEARDIRPPMFIAIALGIITEYLSLISVNRSLSTALGILGITLLWDAFEIYRQQNRIKHGHAPANPNNPRHARILAEYSTATTLDLLKRDPIGREVSPEEAPKLITH